MGVEGKWAVCVCGGGGGGAQNMGCHSGVGGQGPGVSRLCPSSGPKESKESRMHHQGPVRISAGLTGDTQTVDPSHITHWRQAQSSMVSCGLFLCALGLLELSAQIDES